MDLAVVIYYFISPTVAGLTVILNLIEIVLLLKQYKRSTLARTQKHAIPIILFGNLALADLLVGLTVVAIKIMQILYRSYVIPVTRTNLQIFNILKYNFLRLSMLTSFFILIVLTMDRLYAVRYPFSYRSRANNKRAFILVLSTWVLAIAFTSIHYYVSFHSGINIGRYSLIIFPAVVIPATFAFPISNFVIVKAVRKNGQELRRLANNTSSNSDHTKTDDNKSNSTCKGQSAVGSGESRPTINEATLHIIRREAKIYRLALTVVIAFIVCWLPMAICGLLLIAKIHVDSQVINIVFTLAFANSVVNPLAYFCFNDNIRRKIKMLFNTCSRSCFLPQRAGIRDNAQTKIHDSKFGRLCNHSIVPKPTQRIMGIIPKDLIIFPDDAEYKKVPQCTTGRAFVLRFKLSRRKFFFWMQEPKDDKDEEFCKKINDLLNNPPAPGSTGTASGLPPGLSSLGDQLGDSGLQSLLSSMDQNQIMQLLNGTGLGESTLRPTTAASNTGTSRPETQASTTSAASKESSSKPTSKPQSSAAAAPKSASPAVQLSDLQSILANMNSQQESQDPVDLSMSINTESLAPLLADSDTRKRLSEFLPEVGELTNSENEIKETIQSPQFRQALSSFSAALQSGQLAPLIQQFGLGPEATQAATNGDIMAFVKALQNLDDKKSSESQEDHDMAKVD